MTWKKNVYKRPRAEDIKRRSRGLLKYEGSFEINFDTSVKNG